MSQIDQRDEITWLEEQMEVAIKNGQAQTTTRLAFADGSVLELKAMMTTAQRGSGGLVSVDTLWMRTEYDEPEAESDEAARSAAQSAAFRRRDDMIQWLRSVVPERAK